MTEQFANFAQTTLTAAISSTATTITVNSASSFPTSAQYHIVVDSEIMIVTGGAGTTTWTVTRGAEGTTATAHALYAVVANVLTKGSLNQFRQDNISYGTYVNLPTAGIAGRLYQATDGPFIFQDNGTSWQAFGPVLPAGTLTSSTLPSWINQNGATADFTGGSLCFSTSAAPTGTHSILYNTITAPYTVTVHFDCWNTATTGFNGFNLMFLNSSSGAFSNIQVAWSNPAAAPPYPAIYVEKWTNYNTFSAEYTHLYYPTVSSTSTPGNIHGHAYPNWLRIKDDGTTNRYYYYSFDGLHWNTLYTVARTDFVTPNAVGISLRKDGTDSNDKTVRVWSWVQTSP